MRVHTPCLALLFAAALSLPVGLGAGEPGEDGTVRLTLPDDVARELWQPELEPASSAGLASAGRKTETVLLAATFEATWPAAPWRVTHPDDAADVDWGRTDFRAAEGQHSIWCASSGADAPDPGEMVPPNTLSWAIAGPFDLSDATAASLSFDLWLATEQFHDLFMWLASTDGRSFSGSARSSDTDGWDAIGADLTQWPGLGNLGGHTHVWIAFVYQSDHNQQYEGAYVDNVRLVADAGAVAEEGFTYTTSEHFALGSLVGVDSTDNQLRLASGWSTEPFLWVPSPATGTVSKVDIATGKELGRYRTGPERTLEPSPVVIDLDGSCWVGNRAAGSVVKIGLVEKGQCVDRDADGSVDTSQDDDEDGTIAGNELLAWGDDECALFEVVLVAGEEATYTPGEVHDTYADNRLQGLAVSADNVIWVASSTDRLLHDITASSGAILGSVDTAGSATSPFGLVVDANGALWSSSWPDPWVLRLDLGTSESAIVDLDHGSRGLALDRSSHLFVTGFADAAVSRLDVGQLEVDWVTSADWQANGVAVSPDGHFWVAASGTGTVRRYTNDGYLLSTLDFAIQPTGVALDADGKLWVVGASSPVIVRVDPETGYPDLEKNLIGSVGHETASDLTGIVGRSVTSRYGTWTAVWDSNLTDTAWGNVSWVGSEPEGTSLRVRARSSRDQAIWSAWEVAGNDVPLSATPAGRYLQVEVALQGQSGAATPVLEELTVSPAVVIEQPTAEFSWEPVEPEAGERVLFTDESTGGPTSWSWSFGDGATSDTRSPEHVFAAASTYNVTLQVSNEAGASSVTHQVVVRSPSGCGIVCDATVPASAETGEAVPFAVTATATGCEGAVSYLWQFGDGSSSTEAVTTHTYASAGPFPWAITATVEDVNCTRNGLIIVTDGGSSGCTGGTWVPVVIHAAGAMGSVWRSDVGLLSAATTSTTAELRLHAPAGVVTEIVEVAPQALVALVDVVDWISPGSETAGALEVCADNQLVVTSRTYNQLAEDDPCLPGGSFGQYLDGATSDAGLSTGEVGLLSQLSENAAFRTNIGLVNTGPDPAAVAIRLLDSAGATLAEYTASLEPGEWWQDPRPFSYRGGRDDLDAGWARVEATGGSGVVAYASVIDNVTNDATTIPMRR